MTKRYLTAQSLYDLAPVKETSEIWNLIDIFQTHYALYNVAWSDNTRLTIKHYAEYLSDGIDDIWELYSVWIDQEPFMIVQRYGKSDSQPIVTHKDRFSKALAYIRELSEEEEIPFTCIDPNEKHEKIDTFGNFSLSNLYDPDFTPFHRKGDIVTASIATEKTYGYIFSSTPFHDAKVQITKVNPTNPHETYVATETGRKTIGTFRNKQIVPMDHPEKGEPIYVYLNQQLRQVR